jgi:hypothetical protein
MTWAEIGLAMAGAVAVAWWLVWVSAQRLDRLHRRVASARVSLGHQLMARAVAALDVAHAGVLDPASAILVDEAARFALAAIEDDGGPAPGSGPAQSELSATVRTAVGSGQDVASLGPEGAGLVADLGEAWYRVTLARRFYNEAVDQTRRRRRTWPVRYLHLAGRTPLPASFEMDDSWPGDLPRSGLVSRPGGPQGSR